MKSVEEYYKLLAKHGSAPKHVQDELLLSPEGQVLYFSECLRIAEDVFGPARLAFRVQRVRMERVHSSEQALALLYDARKELAKRNYCWLRDIVLARVRLSATELLHFFRSALKDARAHCPRVYRYFL